MTLTIDETQVEVKVIKQTSEYGIIEIAPLPRGFGHSLGNALRRVLLSALPGAAISQVKFEGVLHQFSTIPGVKEDVVDLLLNLKQVRLRIRGDQPVALSLSVRGPKEVTAGDLVAPAGVEIVNKGLHLATLADKKTKLSAELIAEPGRGYVPAEEREAKIGVIPLDCVFSPVVNVACKVEQTRVGRVSNYDRLVLEITTDRTIKPLEALVEASRILARFFDRISLGEAAKRTPPKEKAAKPKVAKTSLEEVDLPLRVINSLKKARITTLDELAQKTPEQLLAIKNIGETSLKKIEKVLKKEGLR